MKKFFRNLFNRSVLSLSRLGIGKYHKVRVTAKFMKSHLKQDVVEVHGHKIFLDVADSLNLSTKIFEEFEVKVVQKMIRKGDVVIDLGAHIGYYTLLFANLVGKTGRVIAFEPEPTNYELLEKNLKINGYKNVVLVNKAVSSKTGKNRLYLDEFNTAGNTLFKLKEDQASIEIDSISLDDYFKDYGGKINFVKMDIEGEEPEAIKGMCSILRRRNGIKIMTEFNPWLLEKNGKNPEEYIQLLEKFDFNIYEIDTEDKRLIPFSFEKLLKIPQSEKKSYFVNLLCVRGEIPQISK